MSVRIRYDKYVCSYLFIQGWDFLICAANQLINHLDKFKHMTGYDSHVIIRVGKGSDDPLDPRRSTQSRLLGRI